MFILGQTPDFLLVSKKNLDLNTENGQAFVLDLQQKIAFRAFVFETLHFVNWEKPVKGTKFPSWFDGKETPRPSLDKQEIKNIQTFLDGGYIAINQRLRNKKNLHTHQTDIINALFKSLALYGNSNYPKLYGAITGLNIDDLGLKKGVSFMDFGMHSAFDNISSAKNLLGRSNNYKKGILIKYFTKKENLRPMLDLGFMGKSHELLFQPNTIYTVVNAYRNTNDGYDTVTMDTDY